MFRKIENTYDDWDEQKWTNIHSKKQQFAEQDNAEINNEQFHKEITQAGVYKAILTLNKSAGPGGVVWTICLENAKMQKIKLWKQKYCINDMDFFNFIWKLR